LKIESLIPVYGGFDEKPIDKNDPTKSKKRKLETSNQEDQIDNILLSEE
jgi:hypothetical protein